MSSVAAATKSNPCTNYPMNCPRCSNGRPVFKYDYAKHFAKYHGGKNGVMDDKEKSLVLEDEAKVWLLEYDCKTREAVRKKKDKVARLNSKAVIGSVKKAANKRAAGSGVDGGGNGSGKKTKKK